MTLGLIWRSYRSRDFLIMVPKAMPTCNRKCSDCLMRRNWLPNTSCELCDVRKPIIDGKTWSSSMQTCTGNYWAPLTKRKQPSSCSSGDRESHVHCFRRNLPAIGLVSQLGSAFSARLQTPTGRRFVGIFARARIPTVSRPWSRCQTDFAWSCVLSLEGCRQEWASIPWLQDSLYGGERGRAKGTA